jgi:hypothetical protein
MNFFGRTQTLKEKAELSSQSPPDNIFKVIQEFSDKDIKKIVDFQKEKGYYLHQISTTSGNSLEWAKAILWFKKITSCSESDDKK